MNETSTSTCEFLNGNMRTKGETISGEDPMSQNRKTAKSGGWEAQEVDQPGPTTALRLP